MHTERLGNFLKKHSNEMQKCIEDLTKTPLGDVSIRPYSERINEIIQLKEKQGLLWILGGERTARRYLQGVELMLSPAAQVVGSTIYYNTSPLGLLLTGNYLWHLTAHELGHILHHAIVGSDEFFCFKDTREQFADFIASYALRKNGVEVCNTGRIGARKFIETLTKSGMTDTIENGMRYISANSDISRKSDGDYKIAES
jgi:hypothetical protein